MNSTYRAGLVGTGSIASHHVAALRSLPGVELVGVTDLDAARAREFGERLGTATFPSVKALREAGADVVHVLTPPASHAAVAIDALELGCHVLVEKPLATSVEDCRRIEEVARRVRRVASVDHSLLFDPQILRALELVRAGKLGEVVSVDILRGSAYPPFRGGSLPPQYRTAGYPFRDLGVHAFYVLEAFLGDIQGVDASWESRGGDPNLVYDEWRALVRCRRGLGQVQLSWNVRPMQNQIIIQGTRGVLRLDLFLMSQARRAALPVPKAIERVVNAFTDSAPPLAQLPIGIAKFALGAVKPFQGLHGFVHAFYRSLDGAAAPPVALADATRVVRWVEDVARAAEEEHAERLRGLPWSERCDVLVTGASGAVGDALLRRMGGSGKLRVLVRRVPAQLPPDVEVAVGDLGDPEAVDRAVAGARAVIHLGAATRGGWDDHERATIAGTRNVLASCRKHGVEKLVHVSSMSVVDWAGADGGVLTEASPDEPRAAERGHYTRAKLEAERLVRAAAQDGVPAVILRPGQIFGGRLPVVSGAVARRLGRRWLVLGDGRLKVPLVYMDDVVDGIVAALERPLSHGEVIQLVDPHLLSQNEILAALPERRPVLRFPRPLLFLLGKLSEPLAALLKRTSPVSAYRLRSALSRTGFESSQAEPLLGWSPRVGVLEGIRRASGLAAEPAAAPAPAAAAGEERPRRAAGS